MVLQLATFKVDVTCPIGHPLTAGFRSPAVALADRLQAIGVVLFGDGKPIVLCAVDWLGICNRSHTTWRRALADAAGTVADRVAVQTTHPHCTPWPDDEAQRLVSEHDDVRDVMEPEFCHDAMKRVADAVRDATARPKPFTHIGLGRAKVDRVASNRRLMGDDGKVKAVRWTQTKDPEIRAAPEGLIDPYLKSISFWNGDTKLAAAHYYAVHNTSYDDDQTITCDFLGLARERRAVEEPGVTHVFFNECAGNITAGKYNNGARENRQVLTDRVHAGMVAAEAAAERVSIGHIGWRVEPVLLQPGFEMNEVALVTTLGDPGAAPKDRTMAALKLAMLRRLDVPFEFSCLAFGDAALILHLPGESFIEYQLFAQARSRADWVAVPSYGDLGPIYICMDGSYAEGGYEPIDSLVGPGVEDTMKGAIEKLVAGQRT